MSASLVGSEMCIRDRSCRNHDLAMTMVLATASPKQARNRSSDHKNPVSYTHLTLPTICSV
eukprot:5528044-Alexandrium_andersonii.AAC.1